MTIIAVRFTTLFVREEGAADGMLSWYQSRKSEGIRPCLERELRGQSGSPIGISQSDSSISMA